MPARTAKKTATTSSGFRALTERAIAFERGCLHAAAERVVPHELGTWHRSDAHPRMWVLNELHVIGPQPQLTAARLRTELDRELRPGGHRRVVVEDDMTGQRLMGEFAEIAGWRIGALLVMALLGEAPEPAAGVAREVGEDEFRTIDAAITAAGGDVPPADHAVVVEGHAQMRTATGARMFVGAHNGVDASRTTLFTDGRTGQPETVETLPAHRGRGLAAATVALAARSARDAGCDLVFLVCDAADGPVALYASLGFVPVGRYWAFSRPA